MEFEIDNGAGPALMSKRDYLDSFSHQPVSKSQSILKSFTEQTVVHKLMFTRWYHNITPKIKGGKPLTDMEKSVRRLYDRPSQWIVKKWDFWVFFHKNSASRFVTNWTDWIAFATARRRAQLPTNIFYGK